MQDTTFPRLREYLTKTDQWNPDNWGTIFFPVGTICDAGLMKALAEDLEAAAAPVESAPTERQQDFMTGYEFGWEEAQRSMRAFMEQQLAEVPVAELAKFHMTEAEADPLEETTESGDIPFGAMSLRRVNGRLLLVFTDDHREIVLWPGDGLNVTGETTGAKMTINYENPSVPQPGDPIGMDVLN